jgi:uncharacterized protein YyaL (SSP411 family)
MKEVMPRMTNDRKPNRLVHEKSPYLLQHAYNPVNWFPWSEEAFNKARTEDKPVFLSIGYSTCHWCHVMERESFEDNEVADYLNAHYVAVKVDKEERPDIDAVYMQVCQAFTGRGGWPMTVILSPNKKAFFAGTYFPKHSTHGMKGLLDILAAVIQLWDHDREALLEQSNAIAAFLQNQHTGGLGSISKSDLKKAFDNYKYSYDNKNGGFGKAPKFPAPHNLMFLLRYSVFEQDKRALEMTENTLQSMYRGGMFDHIGFGFSRYSTDDRWLVPHFEKMLYDNALLSIAYLEAYQLTKNELYRRAAEKTLLYITREMTSPEGGFFSAQDADSEGEEGKYYVFTPGQIKAELGEEDGTYFCRYFGITEKGNFEGASIPNLLNNDAYDQQDKRIEGLLQTLYDFRLSRTALYKDDKILTAWNALMITAFAKAYQVLGNEEYRKAAERGAAFIQTELTDSKGRLFVRYRDGEAAGSAYLEDYAFAAWARLALYEATFDALHLAAALKYADQMCDLFEDGEKGGFFLYAEDSEALFIRPKETYDGAVPSGNSAAAYVLSKIAKYTAEEQWVIRADRQLAFLSGVWKDSPAGHSFGLIAAMTELYPSKEIVCVMTEPEDKARLKKVLSKYFAPNTTVLMKGGSEHGILDQIAPFSRVYNTVDGKVTFFVCENRSCAVPFAGFEELEKRIHNTREELFR